MSMFKLLLSDGTEVEYKTSTTLSTDDYELITLSTDNEATDV